MRKIAHKKDWVKTRWLPPTWRSAFCQERKRSRIEGSHVQTLGFPTAAVLGTAILAAQRLRLSKAPANIVTWCLMRDYGVASLVYSSQELLISLEFEDVEVTKYVGDRGIDLRATLAVGGITDVQTAIQAKRHTSGSVGGPVVRELRGGLGPHERGLIITLSRFSKEARREASERDRSPISLVDGEQLLDLLIQNQIGVNATSRSILELDEGFFTEDATPESGELPSAAASGAGLSGGPSSSQALSLWPLPGGANAWKDSLDQMIQHVAEAAPTMKQAIAWLIASFEQLESTNTARGYWQVPRSLGLIETRGEQLGLTAEGSEYLEDPTREHLLRIAEYRIVGFEKIVHWLSERPHTAQDLLSRAQDELGVEWESQQQILYRLGWLEVLGAAKKSGNSWSPQ